jgi:hypothetical protein
MNTLGEFLTASLSALALGGIVVAVLFRPLFGIVLDLCGTRQRALFWAVYLSTILVLAPVLGVAFIATAGTDVASFAIFLQRALFVALLALTGALVTIGVGLARPVNGGVAPRLPRPAMPRPDKILS